MLSATLAGPSCDASALRGIVGRVDMPQHSLALLVADSLLPGAGRGLFACTTSAAAPLLSSGTPLCALAEGAFAPESRGDSSVPFDFTNPEQLVLSSELELVSLDMLLRRQPESGLFGHRVVRYGQVPGIPSSGGLMISSDATGPDRMFVPRPPAVGGGAEELPPEAWWRHAGQFANDMAFESGLLERPDAYWTYEQASEERNLLSLFWSVRLDEETPSVEWAPEQAWCVTRRDAQLPQSAGVATELGVAYGLDYWRSMSSASLS